MTQKRIAERFIYEVGMIQHYFGNDDLQNINLYYRIGKATVLLDALDLTRLSDKMESEVSAWIDTYIQIRESLNF